jgi:hypothetical protein
VVFTDRRSFARDGNQVKRGETITLSQDLAIGYLAKNYVTGEREFQLLLHLARNNIELGIKPAEAQYIRPD